MAQGSAGARQNPYKLLFLEMVLHLLAVAVFYTRLSPTLPANGQYAILGTFAAAITLRGLTSTLSSSESPLTGNFGRSVGSLQLSSALLLGLCWGLLLPLLQRIGLDSEALRNDLPAAIVVSALALFTGSALNTRLLLTFDPGCDFPSSIQDAWPFPLTNG